MDRHLGGTKGSPATHSSILAWKVPRTEKPVWPQVHGVARVGQGLATKPPSPPKEVRCVARMCSRSVPESFMIHLGRQNQPCSHSVAQSCPTLGDPMDCSPSDSSVRGIFQARILEWVAISYSSINHSMEQ